MIWWLTQNWQIVIGAALYAALIMTAWRYLGWRGALAVATLGITHYAYTRGQKHEAERNEQRNRQAQDTRREVDRAIDEMGDDDVRDRLSRWMRR